MAIKIFVNLTKKYNQVNLSIECFLHSVQTDQIEQN
jgi:hypothetical protein